MLRHVDPHRPHGAIHRAFVRLASSRAAIRLSLTPAWSAIVWRLDRVLLRVTRGRLGTGLLLPTALLETTGARSGRLRRTAVIYFHDGECPTIVASHAGRPRHPAWFHNVRAIPDVRLGGEPFVASIVTSEPERERLWALADRVFPAFARYRASTDREIPIVQLLSAPPREG